MKMNPDPFFRFQSLVKRVLSVPKAEVDRQKALAPKEGRSAPKKPIAHD